MNILFPVGEAVPFAKTGGLADVAGALPAALARLGHSVHVIMPAYRHVRQIGALSTGPARALAVPLGAETVIAKIHDRPLGEHGPVMHFIEHDPFFDRPELYGTSGGDYPDNDRRFTFFDRAVMEWGRSQDQSWDILHCHDWHTGLVPAYRRTLYADVPAYRRARTLLTIHNLAYQGLFPPSSLAWSGLPAALFQPEGLEFWGRLSFLKAGLVYADRINTVSPTYAREIQTPEYGDGLDGVLRARREVLSGILNGLDHVVWDPAEDRYLPVHFQVGRMAGKTRMKRALLEELGLYPLEGAPLLALITRLDKQKGLDVLADAMDRLMGSHLQMVILGTGSKVYHDLVLRFKARYPRKLSVHLLFDNALSHRIYAASDLFLMPSHYEPCGLGQMIAMRYGSVPVVRRTGGLADTVRDFDGRNGNGFLFEQASGDDLLGAVQRALTTYRDTAAWSRLIRNGMREDFSWERSARDYETLYLGMLGRSPSEGKSGPSRKKAVRETSKTAATRITVNRRNSPVSRRKVQ